MAQIGSLSVKLGLVTAQWTQDTAKARQDAKTLQKAFDELGGSLKTLQGHLKTLGGGLGVAAIGMSALIAKSLSFANEIGDISEGFGITIAKTLQFRDALQTSGVSAEKAQKIMSSLFTKIQEAREGNETTIGQFQKLGLSFQEITTLAPEKAIDRVFQSLSKLGNTYEKVKAIKDLLGKGGIGLSIDEVTKKLGTSTAEYEKHAKNIEKVKIVSDNLKTSMDNLTIAFTDLISPFTRDGIVQIETFKAVLIGIGSVAVINGIIKLAEVVRILAASWAALTLAISASPVGIIMALVGALSALGVYLAAKTDASSFEGFDLSGAMGTGSAEIMGTTSKSVGELPAVTSKASKDETAIVPPRPELEAAKARLAVSQKLLELQKEQAEYQLDAYKYSDLQNKQLELMFNFRKQMLEFEAKEADIKKQNMGKPDIQAALLKNLEVEKQATIDLYKTKAELLTQEERNRQSFSYGWEQAFRKYAEDARDYSKVGAEAFKAVVQSMEDAIVKFVTTGKMNFKSFAQTIITELIRIQAQALARNITAGLFGASGVLSGVGGWLSGLMSGGSGTDFLTGGMSFPSVGIKTNATGGSLSGGNMSLVGEKGPELFIPNTSGTVIPNNQLSSMLGGSTTVNNYNINAIDTKSFEDRLYGSSNAIWAANQYAQNKNLATSRSRT